MELPLIIFLYIYYAFLVVWGILFLIALYHMFRFGFKNLLSILVVIIFVGVASLMLNASFMFIFEIEWDETITVFDSVANVKLPF